MRTTKKVLTLKETASKLATPVNFVYVSEENNSIHVLDNQERVDELLESHPDLFDIKNNKPVEATTES